VVIVVDTPDLDRMRARGDGALFPSTSEDAGGRRDLYLTTTTQPIIWVGALGGRA